MEQEFDVEIKEVLSRVHLKRGKLLREFFAVYKINSAGDFDLMI